MLEEGPLTSRSRRETQHTSQGEPAEGLHGRPRKYIGVGSSCLPAYSDTADFLSPTHCRLCLWDAVGQGSAAGSTDAQPDAHSVAADRFTNDHHNQQGALNTLEVEMEEGITQNAEAGGLQAEDFS